jgi:pimeloyl-ACP methyl ester carboxylesterase
VSTPTSLDLPEGTRRATIETARGEFAALDAVPAAGPCELGPALLIPGYTGSKEDFTAILGPLAAAGRQVIAIDLRGQYQTAGPDDPAAYAIDELGADVSAIADATGAWHLLGHSFGGLVARSAVLGGYAPRSLTLLSSGPGTLPGPRAEELRRFLQHVGSTAAPDLKDADLKGADLRGADLKDKVAELWQAALRPQAVAAGVPAPILGFLGQRMLGNNPTGLVTMAEDLLSADDRTDELAARAVPTFVLYGEDDNAWPPALQQEMAVRLGAERTCIPAAAHNPNVEAPATTAHALTTFWNATER